MIAYKDFTAQSRLIAANLIHRGFINKALGGYEVSRDRNILKFQNWGAARQAAADVKYETFISTNTSKSLPRRSQRVV